MKIEPLPQVSASKVIGLLEYLDDHQGEDDIYRLAETVHYELGELLAVIKMAEMLGFAETPGGDVVLQNLGKKLIKSKMNQRKLMIRERLSKLKIFQSLIKILKDAESAQLDRETILKALSQNIPHENSEELFKTVVNWGRFAELLGYNHDTQILYLDEEAFPNLR